MAMRLEQTKGDLRQQVADRLGDGFSSIRGAVEEQIKAGRHEQSGRLDGSADRTHFFAGHYHFSTQIRVRDLNQKTMQSLDSIRDRVDVKLHGDHRSGPAKT